MNINLSALRRIFFALAALAPLSALQAQSNYATPYTFTTLAGSATVGSTDGTGVAASFDGPVGVAVDSSGTVYIADSTNKTIRKITSDGVVTTLAGAAGQPGWVDGTGSAARFYLPDGIAVDTSGNIYVSDAGDGLYFATIRKITPAGVVSTLAGGGKNGYADGKGSAAQFYVPSGLAVDPAGNIYVADSGNCMIRKIAPDGTVTTLAGTLGNFGIVGAAGSADGQGTAASFSDPRGVAIDGAGNIYVADDGNQEIRKVTADGYVTTLAGLAGVANTGPVDATGNAARFLLPTGVASDALGNLYIAEIGYKDIRKITPEGLVTTIAGNFQTIGSADGTGSAAKFLNPQGIALDHLGNVYVADDRGLIRKGYLATAPTVSTEPTSQSAPANGNVNFNIIAAGTGPFSYQWQDLIAGSTTWANLSDNSVYSGSTTDTLTLTAAIGALNGNQYRCIVTNASGSITSDAATLTVPNAQLINISTRSYVGTGANIQIAGFVITGSQPKQVLVRASGPALTGFSLNGVLPDPVLQLFQGVNPIYSNTVWGSAANATDIKTAAAHVGAFPWADGSKDSALLVTLQPGLYTAEVSGQTGDSGIALVEAYDVDSAPASRMINISTRSLVKTGDNIQIAGFVITGTQSKQVLIRASGPALTSVLTGVLPDPVLQLFKGNAPVTSNTVWGSASNVADIKAAALRLGAFTWADGSNDSALLLTLQPGAYTAEVSGQSGDSGIALVEVYDADPK